MENSTLILNRTSLLDLMKNFYILTGIRIVLFDNHFQEILAWPTSHCHFCELMHKHEHTRMKCNESDQNSFHRCRKKGSLEIYHCHAGLVEATAPLIDNDKIIGYVMFGQISDFPNQETTTNNLQEILNLYQLNKPDNQDFFDVTHKTFEQIESAAKILEACTFYVVLKDLVTLRRQNFANNLNTFLMEHLSEDLSIERLMTEFHISRNKLYDSVNGYLGIGIAEHIRNLRIKEAKRLLKETNYSVHKISDMVGFNDYNYFCRIFKKETGSSALQYRKRHSNF